MLEQRQPGQVDDVQEISWRLPIHTRWYELPLGICRSGDLSVAPSLGGEHDARDKTRMYRDTMHKNAM